MTCCDFNFSALVHTIMCFLLQFAIRHLKELEHQKRELQKEGNALIDFFCEDKETMKLDECFQIFRDFCVRFNKAVKVRAVNKFIIHLKQVSAHRNWIVSSSQGTHVLWYLWYLMLLLKWLQQTALL